MTTFHILMLVITIFWVPIASGLIRWLWTVEDRLSSQGERLKSQGKRIWKLEHDFHNKV